MAWQQLNIVASQDDALILSAWLENYALAVSMGDAGDEQLFQQQPADTPLWQQVNICALFTDEEDLTPVVEHIKTNCSQLQSISISSLAEEDWVKQTQCQFSAQCFGERLWVVPSWETPPRLSSNQVMITLNPGLAFGTGTHATTTLCLEWLTTHSLLGKSVIDFGCGSGILALAALALSANTAWAIDHDPQALLATQNNAALNTLLTHNTLHIVDSTNLPEKPSDVVIANILSKPLIELAPTLIHLTADHGYLVLSGLLTQDVAEVIAAYQPICQLTTCAEKEDWVCLTLQKNSRAK